MFVRRLDIIGTYLFKQKNNLHIENGFYCLEAHTVDVDVDVNNSLVFFS